MVENLKMPLNNLMLIFKYKLLKDFNNAKSSTS